MPFFPPIPLIRRNAIIKKLTECGAFSDDKAVTLRDAGVINPDAFSRITDKLVKDGLLKKTKDNKFYLNR